MPTTEHGSDVQHLSPEHRDRAWRDRFNARWHYDYGGWIRTRPQDEASTFALIPTKHYGPFTEDHSCPACLVVHPPEDCPVLSGNTDMLCAATVRRLSQMALDFAAAAVVAKGEDNHA